MDPLLSINSNSSVASLLGNQMVGQTYGLLAAGLSLSTPGLFGDVSSSVGISARGQLLSASVAFQDKLQALRPGSITSGGGQNFGTDFASLAAETQSLVDTFNTLQVRVADLNRNSNLPASGGSADLVRALDTQAQAVYANGDSALTKLAQLGIEFQPALIPGGSSKLSLDLDKLRTAFESDAAGSFALLSKAADALGNVAGGFISRSGSQYASLDALLQSSSGIAMFANLPQALTGNNLFSALANQTPDGGGTWRQMYAAISEYSMVSQLFG